MTFTMSLHDLLHTYEITLVQSKNFPKELFYNPKWQSMAARLLSNLCICNKTESTFKSM